MIKNRFVLWLFSCCLIYTGVTLAQVTYTENQPLSFGEFAITDFTTAARLRIRNNGSFIVTGPIAVIIDPTRGEYTLSNGPSKTNYTITTPASIALTGTGPGTFTIDNIRVRPNTLRFNNAGNDNIRVAADLNTPGGGINFSDGVYTGTLDLTISY